jgi:hypothetical protein
MILVTMGKKSKIHFYCQLPGVVGVVGAAAVIEGCADRG